MTIGRMTIGWGPSGAPRFRLRLRLRHRLRLRLRLRLRFRLRLRYRLRFRFRLRIPAAPGARDPGPKRRTARAPRWRIRAVV